MYESPIFSTSELCSIVSALEEKEYRIKDRCSSLTARIAEKKAEGDMEVFEKSIRSLCRNELWMEQTRDLIFKVEAASRWAQAEKVLFPERFQN